MTRPNGYRETYVLNQDTTYRSAIRYGKGPQSDQGHILRGRVVWLQEDPLLKLSGTSVSAYAEGIGVVLLGTDCLDRARLLRRSS